MQTRRTSISLAAWFSAALSLAAAPQTAPPGGLSADQVIDRVIATEAEFQRELAKYHPVIETYLQYTDQGPEAKDVLASDAYFFGKVDFGTAFGFDSFKNDSNGGFSVKSWFKKPGFRLLPPGFVKMAALDPNGLSRDNYVFENLQSEFVGEVRCWVVDVTPKDKEGRFIGRIWAEDRDFHIVRYSGTYGSKQLVRYFHFNGYRRQMGPGLWMPSAVYVEHAYEQHKSGPLPRGLKAQVHLWSYGVSGAPKTSTFTNIQIETPEPAKDRSATDVSSTEALRQWRQEAEENVIARMEKAGLIAPEGEMEKVLDAVLNNLIVTNKVVASPLPRCRILLTTPLESCSIGNTIVLSRGLINVLPNEATLAAFIARELAHIVQGHSIKTLDAFANRTQVEDSRVLQRFRFRRTPEQEESAIRKAQELLKNSPYGPELPSIGLFLASLSANLKALPNLLEPNIGNPVADLKAGVAFKELLSMSPRLAPEDLRQIPALPLGSRLRIDAWDNRAEVLNAKPVAILTADEKLPFEVTPIVVPLRRQAAPTATVKTGAGGL